MSEQISLVKAIVDYFGPHPDPTVRHTQEIKALTPQDRAELRELLIGEGYDIAELKT